MTKDFRSKPKTKPQQGLTSVNSKLASSCTAPDRPLPTNNTSRPAPIPVRTTTAFERYLDVLARIIDLSDNGDAFLPIAWRLEHELAEATKRESERDELINRLKNRLKKQPVQNAEEFDAPRFR